MACLAGPVVAAAVVVRPYGHKIPGVRDSKTLALPQRERLYSDILRRSIAVGVGAASVDEIDRLNILRASHLAMRRALRRVAPVDYVLVDGRDFADLDFGPHTAIVDGDAYCYSIACASIVAKVTRDRLMARLAARRPGYGWEQNVGYPTREHRSAIHQQGVTPHHRRSFGTVRLITMQPMLEL
jgi:ribonuclease HII